MGILSMFRKATPREIYEEIAIKIVFLSLNYRDSLVEELNMKLTGDAGAEYAYLLLHLADRAAFKMLGATRRNVVFDEIAKIVIAKYCRAVLLPSTPESKAMTLASGMMDDMNDRQDIYGQCTSLVGDVGPSVGTMLFALGYFVHLALQRTIRKDVDDILCGKRKLTRAEIDDFPKCDDLDMLAIHFGASLRGLRINDSLRKLR